MFLAIAQAPTCYYMSKIYLYKAEKPSGCPSVTPITYLRLLVSTYQVPNTYCSSSTCYQELTRTSVHSAKWVEHKGVEHSFENRRLFRWKSTWLATKSRWLKSSCWHHFEIIPFGHSFLLLNFETVVTRHPNHLWRQDLSEIKCPSSGNSNIVAVYWYLLLSVLYSTLKALV